MAWQARELQSSHRLEWQRRVSYFGNTRHNKAYLTPSTCHDCAIASEWRSKNRCLGMRIYTTWGTKDTIETLLCINKFFKHTCHSDAATP